VSTHMKRLFQKTGTQRQAELASLVSAMASPFLPAVAPSSAQYRSCAECRPKAWRPSRRQVGFQVDQEPRATTSAFHNQVALEPRRLSPLATVMSGQTHEALTGRR
jgi:hypothetical protein